MRTIDPLKNPAHALAAMPSRKFLWSIGGAVAAALIFFTVVATGHVTVFDEYNGVAINPATKACGVYTWDTFFGNSTHPWLPAPKGWQVYATPFAQGEAVGGAQDVITTPYGSFPYYSAKDFCASQGLHLVQLPAVYRYMRYISFGLGIILGVIAIILVIKIIAAFSTLAMRQHNTTPRA